MTDMSISGKHRKIYFIDQTSEKDHHMVFNASMLKILMLLFPAQPLTYYGIESSQEAVRQLLNPGEQEAIQFCTIRNPKVERNSRPLKALNYMRKEKIRFSTFREILKTAHEDDLLVLSITTFSSFLFFKYLKGLFKTKVISVLHGDIDFIYYPASRLSQLNAFSHKQIFKKKQPSFKYLLLNKIAKRILVKDHFLNEDEVFEIDHPFTFLSDELPARNVYESKPVTIGHIGSMEVERKGSHLIYDVAGKLHGEIAGGQIEFKVVGLITPGVLKYKNEWVTEIVGNQDPGKPDYLTRAQYESELRTLDYCIFFYPKHEYVFRASGAVVDFISKQIPIIVLKHPYFDYLFEIGGNIGFSCESPEEMERLLKKIAARDAAVMEQYATQQLNLGNLKDRFSVHTIARDLGTQIKPFLNQ